MRQKTCCAPGEGNRIFSRNKCLHHYTLEIPTGVSAEWVQPLSRSHCIYIYMNTLSFRSIDETCSPGCLHTRHNSSLDEVSTSSVVPILLRLQGSSPQVTAIRRWMEEERFDAFLIPTDDPHLRYDYALH